MFLKYTKVHSIIMNPVCTRVINSYFVHQVGIKHLLHNTIFSVDVIMMLNYIGKINIEIEKKSKYKYN